MWSLGNEIPDQSTDTGVEITHKLTAYSHDEYPTRCYHASETSSATSSRGEFVWTGFDYLGEPTPYNKDLTNLLNFSEGY